jgi:hypothetical protein
MYIVPGFRRLQPFAGFGAERLALRHNNLLVGKMLIFTDIYRS